MVGLIDSDDVWVCGWEGVCVCVCVGGGGGMGGGVRGGEGVTADAEIKDPPTLRSFQSFCNTVSYSNPLIDTGSCTCTFFFIGY